MPEPIPKKRNKKRGPSIKSLDTDFSKLVRSVGVCEIGKVENCPSGNLQCAHGFSRRYKSVRWDRRNAFSACAGCHYWYTLHPIEWDDFLRGVWGPVLYDELRELSLQVVKVDLRAVSADLKESLKELAA